MDYLFIIALICGLISVLYTLYTNKNNLLSKKLLLFLITLYTIGYIGVYSVELMDN